MGLWEIYNVTIIVENIIGINDVLWACGIADLGACTVDLFFSLYDEIRQYAMLYSLGPLHQV